MRLGVIGFIAATAAIAATTACTNPVNRGAPCGRGQYASASVTLPDTGINAGTDVVIGFDQHDPDLSGELSEIVVQHIVPVERRPDPEPDPRVRLLNGAGRVLLDTLGTRSSMGTSPTDRPTWLVLHWIRNADERTALFEAFRDSTLILELWAANATQPGTRVHPRIGSVGVTPPMTCL